MAKRRLFVLVENASSNDEFIGLIRSEFILGRGRASIPNFLRDDVELYALILDNIDSRAVCLAAGKVERIEEHGSDFYLYLGAESGFDEASGRMRLLEYFRYSVSPDFFAKSQRVIGRYRRRPYLVSDFEFFVLRSGARFSNATLLYTLIKFLPDYVDELPDRSTVIDGDAQRTWKNALESLVERLETDLVSPAILASQSLRSWQNLRQRGSIPMEEASAITFALAQGDRYTKMFTLIPETVEKLARVLKLEMNEESLSSGLIDEIRAEINRCLDDPGQRDFCRRFPYPGPWRR